MRNPIPTWLSALALAGCLTDPGTPGPQPADFDGTYSNSPHTLLLAVTAPGWTLKQTTVSPMTVVTGTLLGDVILDTVLDGAIVRTYRSIILVADSTYRVLPDGTHLALDSTARATTLTTLRFQHGYEAPVVVKGFAACPATAYCATLDAYAGWTAGTTTPPDTARSLNLLFQNWVRQ